MDWDNVRVFLAVARAGQFVAAARRLRLDHATVSRRIAALEAALGARLFERLTTGARLTSSGERFLAAELWRKLGDGGEEGGVTGLVIKPPASPRWSVTP
jgi:molybdenum-dependent DNA-binding transcriptional regulator ModE